MEATPVKAMVSNDDLLMIRRCTVANLAAILHLRLTPRFFHLRAIFRGGAFDDPPDQAREERASDDGFDDENPKTAFNHSVNAMGNL
jgi:hypothetical protein